jgi:hypothetical protein
VGSRQRFKRTAEFKPCQQRSRNRSANGAKNGPIAKSDLAKENDRLRLRIRRLQQENKRLRQVAKTLRDECEAHQPALARWAEAAFAKIPFQPEEAEVRRLMAGEQGHSLEQVIATIESRSKA